MRHRRGSSFPIIIGLTGSIAMGKSTVARQFAHYGAAFCDSDLLVHRILRKDKEAVARISELFPAAMGAGVIDRKRLGKEVFADPEKLKALEAVLHPLVRRAQERFIRQARKRGKRIVVLDIPLLFETQGERRCDYTVSVSAPAFLQHARALARPQMTEMRLKNILARQMKDAEKRKRADFVVMTGIGKYASRRAVAQILLRILGKSDRTQAS